MSSETPAVQTLWDVLRRFVPTNALGFEIHHPVLFYTFFWIGVLFGWVCVGLAACSVTRMMLRSSSPDPAVARTSDIFAYLLAFTAICIGAAYVSEAWVALSGNSYEAWMFIRNRVLGRYAWAYWDQVLLAALCPQLLWSRKVRAWPLLVFLISILALSPQWIERLVLSFLR
jgi:molybdopterin-containing oxidoreductase family membrane subunit